MVSCVPLVDPLRRIYTAASTHDVAGLLNELKYLPATMAELFATPVRVDGEGLRRADPGAGDAYLACKGARDAVAAMPALTGAGGVAWSPAWAVGLLDYLMLLLAR